MRSRVIRFARALCLLPCLIWMTVWATPRIAGGQIRATAAPRQAESSPKAATALIPTSLSLNLCVDGSTTYPCPNPVTSDYTFVPSISLTYGQNLDGVVVYGPAGLNSGTITIYKDNGTGRVPICTLLIGIDLACPANSTIFDVDTYTLSATLTFPAGSAYANFDTSLVPCGTNPTCDVMVSVAKDTSAIALSSSQNPSAFGSPVTITAQATGGYGATPTGQVVFTVDTLTLVPMTLDANGRASFPTTSLTIGTHDITASYAGALDFYPAADARLSPPQVIVPPATTTTVASSLNPSALGDKVTFTASIANAAGFAASPSGSAAFRDGNVTFATGPVAQKGGQSVAQTTISTLATGSHSITAAYSGDGSNSPSVSPTLVQQVNYPLTLAPPGYRITVTPSPVALGVGQTADLTVTVTAISGFSAPVTLNCSDLPNESACTFGENVIPAGGGSTTLAFSTMAPHDCGSTVPYFIGTASLHRPASLGARCAVPALAGVLLLVLPRRFRMTRWMRPMLAVVFAGGLLTLAGCGGHCTDFGTPPGGYTFKVNGTASPTGTSTASDPGAVNVTTSVAVSVKL